MDITSEAPAAKDGARVSYCTAFPRTEMSQPTVDDHLSEPSDVGEGPLRDENFVLGQSSRRSPEISAFDISLVNETRATSGSLSTEGSATSVDTVTLTNCQPDPSAVAAWLSRDGTPTPPPTGASAANRHGKFKKSLEDRYRIGQGAGDNLNRSGSTSSLTATTATVGHCRQSTLKRLQVEDAQLPAAAGIRGLRDGEPRKSHSMDEGGRKSRSVDAEWPAPRASAAAGQGVRSSSFDPCSSVAAVTDDSPLDLSSRSAIGSGGLPPTTPSSSADTSVPPPARRDAYRRAQEEFEERARQRHLRKRSESEENIHVSYNGAATATALAFAPLVAGRLYHSDLRIDQSGRNGTTGDASYGHDVGTVSTMAIAVARDPSSFDQPPVSSAAHLSLRRRQQQHAHQHRQKSCSPTPCLGRRLLQPTPSPKGYSSSLEDGSPNRLPSDDEARLPVVRIAGDSAAGRPSPSSEVQRNGACTPSAAAPGWRVTPPVQLFAGPDSMDDGSGCGSPSGHSPGGSTLSADDLAAAGLSAGGSGSFDDASAVAAGGAGSPGAAGGARLHFCPVCERSFSRSDMLTRHVRLHTGLKPYECQLCGQQFSRSDHLSTHQRTHTGERPYRCPHCPYAACRRDMITRHLRVHGRSSSGGGSSEDDAGGGLLAAAAAAVAAVAPLPGDVAVAACTAADVRIKRRRLLQRGPWSGSGGSGSGGGSAATDLSSSWDSSLSYSFGSSSIESASGCANAADVSTAAAAAAFGLGSAGSGSGGGGTCGWLQALPQSRADAVGRSWRWSSNGSSSSSSGLGASLGCSSPDAGSSGGPRTFGNSAAVTSTATACGTTALPPFADVSWADTACGERTGQPAVGDVLPPGGGQTQSVVAIATAAVERAVSCGSRSPATSVPLWSTMPFGFSRPGLPAAAGGGSLPAAAMAAALLYAAPPPTLALFGSIGAGMPSGPCERVQVALQSAAAGVLGRSRMFDAGAAATATEPVPAYAASISSSAKERKSLVRQDASMEQEDEPQLPLAPATIAPAAAVSAGTASAADLVKMVALPATAACSGQPPLYTLAQQQQQMTQKAHRAAAWLPHSSGSSSNGGMAGSALASTAAFVAPGTSAAVHAAGSPATALSVANAPLPGSAAATAAVGGLRQASLSDELGKVSMTE